MPQNKYTRTVYKCATDEERKKLKKIARKRYYIRNKEKVKERNKIYYLKNQKRLQKLNSSNYHLKKIKNQQKEEEE
jgi:hypothetical protein